MIQFAVLCALALLGGAAAATQAGANAGLAARIGLPQALVVNTSVVLLFALAFWLARGAGTAFFPAGTPPSLYVGGVCGFIIIAALAFAFPRLGAARAVALMVLGQGIAAVLIDHYGLLGIPRDAATLKKAAGIALLAAGAWLVR